MPHSRPAHDSPDDSGLVSRCVARRVVPHLLFFPDPLPEELASPGAHGIAGEEVRIATEDGVHLHGWWVPARVEGSARAEDAARDGSPAGAEGAARAASGSGASGSGAAGGEVSSDGAAVLYLHGNAGHVADRAPVAAALARRGLDVLLIDYRGYGRSEGRPSEPGLLLDGRAAYRHLVSERGRSPRRVVVAGHSLGGAVASRVAAEAGEERNAPDGAGPAALVATSTFRSVPAVGRRVYGWLPDRTFRGWPTNRFPAEEWIRRVAAPILVACGGRDAVIPKEETRALFELCPHPRRWVEVPEAGHGDLWLSSLFLETLTQFLDGTLAPPREGPAEKET